MTRRLRNILRVAIGLLLGLILAAVIAAIVIPRTAWFQNYARNLIVQAVDKSTGGRAEVSHFDFSWRHLRIQIHGFVIHGTEPPGEQPLFQAREIAIDLRILPLLTQRRVELDSLKIEQPQANLIVYPGGRTNLPHPQQEQTGTNAASQSKPPLQTVMDLAVGHFDLDNGTVQFADRKTPLEARGENLRAQLFYQAAGDQYRGDVSISPLYVQYGSNPRLDVRVHVPVVLERDRIQLTDAAFTTAASNLEISGSVQHLTKPEISAQLAGQFDLLEMKRSFGLAVPLGKDAPRALSVRAALGLPSEGNRISTAQLALGDSKVQISGHLARLAPVKGSFHLDSSFALAELGRLLEMPFQPGGVMRLAGDVSLDGLSSYSAQATLNGQNLAFRHGNVQIVNAALTARVAADPRMVRAEPIRVSVAGGQFDGRAVVEDLTRYRADGTVNGFDLRNLASLALPQRLAWDGIISGPINVQGALRGAEAGLQVASAHLAIAPGRRGIPLRGQLNADYNGRSEVLNLAESFLALPSSRIDFSGSLGNQMMVRANSRNLNDFLPAIALTSSKPPSELPLRLDPGGSAQLVATVTGKVESPVISGHIAIDRFRVEQRHFDLLAGDLNARSDNVTLRNAMLTHGPLDVELQASIGLDKWKPKTTAPLEASLAVHNADVQDLLAFAEKTGVPVQGTLNVSAQASGTIGDPRGIADLLMVNGEAYGQPIDRIEGRVVYGGENVSVPSLRLVSGAAQANLSGSFHHPADDFSMGNIHAHVDIGQLTLSGIQALAKRLEGIGGEFRANADVDAMLKPGAGISRLHLTALNGTLGARGLSLKGETFGDVSATARTSGNQLAFVLDSDFAGSRIHANGQTDLADKYATTANLAVSNLPIEKALLLANNRNADSRGVLSANGQVSGTLDNPAANLDFSLTRAVLRQQPIDRLTGHVNYSNTVIEFPSLELSAGPNQISASGSFAHAAGTYSSGNLRLSLNSNTLQLAQVRYLEQLKPGLSGTMQFTMDTALTLNNPKATQRVTLSRLNGKVAVNRLRVGQEEFGGFTASAEQAGPAVKFSLDSNLAESVIHGTGQAQLTRDYPMNAQLSFNNIRYVNWIPLIGKSSTTPPGFDALFEGNLSIAGPAVRPRDLTGRVQITKVEVSTAGAALNGGGATVAVRNDGPIAISANQSGVHVERARFTGPATAADVTGDVQLKPAVALNLKVNANADLALLSKFSQGINSAGDIVLSASVKGAPRAPTVDGRLELSNAAFQKTDWPNGISNAKGVILLTGTSARIQSLTAESGGGQIAITGGVTRSGTEFNFNLAARANRVMVLTQSGASATANANVKLTGTSAASLLSGTANVLNVGFQTHTDIGSILTQTAAPMVTPTAPKGILAGMKLDIAVRMGTGASFVSSYTENVEAQADLNLRGTLANPGILGRVTITQGNLIFFGTKYTVNEGSLTFYNPSKIEPILNMNLETAVQGVDVILTVTGPVQNMNFSYHSDPPLQFSEIIALLAGGKTPTSDPVLLANQPSTPQQSIAQMGESALVSTVIANPVAGQLQRVFGVTSLKISPSFISGSAIPEARLTLQQRISSDITFTYVTNLNTVDPQVIRVEWALNPQWSAVLTRDINGIVGVDFFYKHRFR